MPLHCMIQNNGQDSANSQLEPRRPFLLSHLCRQASNFDVSDIQSGLQTPSNIISRALNSKATTETIYIYTYIYIHTYIYIYTVGSPTLGRPGSPCYSGSSSHSPSGTRTPPQLPCLAVLVAVGFWDTGFGIEGFRKFRAEGFNEKFHRGAAVNGKNFVETQLHSLIPPEIFQPGQHVKLLHESCCAFRNQQI